MDREELDTIRNWENIIRGNVTSAFFGDVSYFIMSTMHSISEDDPWSYEIDENVVINDQRGWNDATRDELQELMNQFEELAGDPGVNATVTVMDSDASLDKETQQYLEQNSPVYDRLGINRVALVSDGIQAIAVSSLVETPSGVEIETFDEKQSAMEWCKK